MTATVVVLLGVIWWPRFLPLQDYAEWLFQANIIRAFLSGSSALTAHFVLSWFPTPPNVLTSILLASLGFLVPIQIAGKIFLTAYTLLFIFGWRYLFKQTNGKHPFRWLGLLFAFNYFFFMGFLSYILGLAAMFLATGWLYSSKREVTITLVAILAFIFTLLYLTHGVAYVLFVVVFCFWIFSEENRQTTFLKKVLLAGSLIPSIILLAAYLLCSKVSSVIELTHFPYIQFSGWRYAIWFFHRLVPFPQSLPVSYLNITVWIIVAYLTVRHRSEVLARSLADRLGKHLGAAVVFVALMLLLPASNIGEFYSPGPRFLIPAIVFFFASFAPGVKNVKTEVLIASAAFLMSVVYFIQISSWNTEASAIYEKAKPIYERAQTPLVIRRGFAEEVNRTTPQIISGEISTMRHFHRYFDLENPTHMLSIFETGIVRINRVPDITLALALDSLIDTRHYVDEARDTIRERLFDIRSTFDYIFLFAKDTVAMKLAAVLSPEYDVKARDTHLLILQRKEHH